MLVSLQNFGTAGKEHPLFPQQRVVEAPVLALSCPDDWVPAMRRKLCQVHLTTEAFKLQTFPYRSRKKQVYSLSW